MALGKVVRQNADGGITMNGPLNVKVDTNANILAIASPAQGMLMYSSTDKILYQYDSSRSKWLSVETMPLIFSGNGARDNEILPAGGSAADVNSGYRLPIAACIIRSTIQQDTTTGNLAKQYDIEINGSVSFSETTSSGVFTDNAVNTNLAAADRVNVFVNATGTAANSPVVTLFVKFRCV